MSAVLGLRSPPPGKQVSSDQASFLETIIGEVAGTLQTLVGNTDASSYISLVGLALGEAIYQESIESAIPDYLTPSGLADLLVAIEQRIGGGFSVSSVTRDAIVLHNAKCPYGSGIAGRPSLCMMTTNMLGTIAAQYLDYAAVDTTKTIASGDRYCRVVIRLRPGSETGSMTREYFYREDLRARDAPNFGGATRADPDPDAGRAG